MKNCNIILIIIGALSLLVSSCQSNTTSELKSALTFHASFDDGMLADYALGDKNMYTAESRRKLDSAQVGMNNTDHQFLKGKGRFGDALEFGKKSRKVVFYKSKDNIAYSPNNMSGTVSFWLSLNPAVDLAPGFTDPIQITDVSYNDASIWVDFTKENPRDFRLGVIGDLASWSLDTLDSSQEIEFEKRLVRVNNPPFTNDDWTHIAITYNTIGTSKSAYSLYVNGRKNGTVKGIDDPFTWELEKSNIYLGLSFIGLMDELSIFNKPLTDEEVLEMYELKDGVKSIL